MEVSVTLEDAKGESLPCCIVGIEFFESEWEQGDRSLPREETATEFGMEIARHVVGQIRFTFPKLEAPVDLELVGRFLRADGTIAGEATTATTLTGGLSSACLRCCCGEETPGFWTPGEYRLELFCRGRFIARGSFRIVSAPLAVRLNDFGFLTDRSKRFEFAARLQWTFVKEETPAIQAWASFGCEKLERPCDADVVLCIKWPDGTHEYREKKLHLNAGQTWGTLEVEVNRGVAWPCGPCWVRLRIDGKWIADSSFDVIERQDVLRTRPRVFLPVEPELRKAPPRTSPWVCINKGQPSDLPLLQRGIPCPGWIVSVDERTKEGDPDYAIVFAYEVDGKVTTGFRREWHDLIHWEQGQPKSYWWFRRNIQRGKPVTVLLSDNGEAEIYGLLQPYILDHDEPCWAAGG
jgi:hypothetical protein